MSNISAIYSYCTIPIINYPQLEDELFCNTYYLRHLCDEQKFPDWPIRDPIGLLKDCLNMWKAELEKKGSDMSIDEAYQVLGKYNLIRTLFRESILIFRKSIVLHHSLT